jgi:hypothetical protein
VNIPQSGSCLVGAVNPVFGLYMGHENIFLATETIGAAGIAALRAATAWLVETLPEQDATGC